MAISLKSISKTNALRAPRVVAYGVEGIGKSTFAASAPKPIFIQTEDGLGSLNVPHFPLAKHINEVLEAIGTLYTEKHDYQTVVLDSIDWASYLMQQDIEATHDAKDLSYGKDQVIAAAKWRDILDGLNALRNEKGMTVILLAHCQIKRFDSPETEPYDRFQMKLPERTSALVREWCDALLFLNYKTIVRKTEVGFNKEVSRGITTGERLMYTAETPAFQAKNRYSLPASLPLSFDALMAAISNQSQPATEKVAA